MWLANCYFACCRACNIVAFCACGLARIEFREFFDVGLGCLGRSGEHLRLFSEESALGVQASVYNVNATNWIAPSEPVDDIEQGKDRAAEHARVYLRKAANLELPSLQLKKSHSV